MRFSRRIPGSLENRDAEVISQISCKNPEVSQNLWAIPFCFKMTKQRTALTLFPTTIFDEGNLLEIGLFVLL